MKYCQNIIYAVVIVISSASCTTHISFPVTVPPVIETGEEELKIAFVSRYDHSMLSFENEKKTEVFIDGSETVIRSLESAFDKHDHLGFFRYDTLLKGKAFTLLPEPMDKSVTRAICAAAGSDLLLVLESFNAEFDTETVSEEHESGRSITNYVDLEVRAGLSLYDNEGKEVDRVSAFESKPYQKRAALSRFVVIGPSMKKAGDDVNQLAGRIGPNYVSSFFPSDMIVNRMIYTGKELTESKNLMALRKYEAAIKLLEPLTDHPDPKIAGRAAHNLAVACEALGDFEAFDYWMQKSPSNLYK